MRGLRAKGIVARLRVTLDLLRLARPAQANLTGRHVDVEGASVADDREPADPRCLHVVEVRGTGGAVVQAQHDVDHVRVLAAVARCPAVRANA